MKRQKKNPMGLLIAVAVVAVATSYAGQILYDRADEPVLVAVVDTGIDFTSDPKLAARAMVNKGEVPANGVDDDGNGRVDDLHGWNFFDSNADVKDSNGHGTEVARRVIAACPRCGLLAVRVTRNGAGVRPADLAQALAYSLARGAKVINLSFGLNGTSPELEQAMAAAENAGALVVMAAGAGVPNPYKAAPLSTLFPQSYATGVVVGVAPAPDQPELILNYGPQLDLVTLQAADAPKRGSSYAAGEISGAAAEYVFSHGKMAPSDLRHRLRAATVPFASPAPERTGYGIFEAERFFKQKLEDPMVRLVPVEGGTLMDLSTGIPLAGAVATVRCGSVEIPMEALKNEYVSKGRVWIKIVHASASVPRECHGKLTLQLKGGGSRVAEF